VSSIEPNDAGGEIDGREEVAGGLVIARCDRAELLEPGEEVLDQMACLVEVAVIGPRRAATGLWRDHDGLAGGRQRLDDPLVGIEGLVGDQCFGLHVGQQVIRTVEIMRLTARQMKANRVAERIDQGMDLGAQAAARAADGLVFGNFFWAPALC